MARASSDLGLDVWLTPFLAAMGHKKRRRWAPLYLRGLLGPGARKSLQPMASRLGLSGHDQLQHFIASPAWNDGPLWTALARTADRLVGGEDACLVIDDTALPKKGTLSVGVARQYCGALGKKANCQSLVSLTLARGDVPVPVALRLFLPDEWVTKPERCRQTGVPEGGTVPRDRGEIALAELHCLRKTDMRFRVVLRPMLATASGPPSAVASTRAVRVGQSAVRGTRRSTIPTCGSSRPSAAPACCAGSGAARGSRGSCRRPWRGVTWRRGIKGMLSAHFAVIQVRVGDRAAGPATGTCPVPRSCAARLRSEPLRGKYGASGP